MAKIVGNVVGIPNPQSDWEQKDEKKADYIKNKPFEVAEGVNSMEQESCEAVSKYSVAFGADATAGLRGFIISDISAPQQYTGKYGEILYKGSLTLQTILRDEEGNVISPKVDFDNSIVDFSDSTTANHSCYQMNDKFSILSNYPDSVYSYYNFCGHITDVSNPNNSDEQLISYEGALFDFTQLLTDERSMPIVFFVPSKPRIGCVESVVRTNPETGEEKIVVLGGQSFAHGVNVQAGRFSAAFGMGNQSSEFALTFGGQNKAGYCSIAGGAGNNASEYYGTALGMDNEITGRFSSAIGKGLIARGDNQTVRGRYNVPDNAVLSNGEKGKYLEILGGGTKEAYRWNNRTVNKETGLEWVRGGVKVGGEGEDDANAKFLITEDAVKAGFTSKTDFNLLKTDHEAVKSDCDNTKSNLVKVEFEMSQDKEYYYDTFADKENYRRFVSGLDTLSKSGESFVYLNNSNICNPTIKVESALYPVDVEYYGTNLLDMKKCNGFYQCEVIDDGTIQKSSNRRYPSLFYIDYLIDIIKTLISKDFKEGLTFSFKNEQHKNCYISIVFNFKNSDLKYLTFNGKPGENSITIDLSDARLKREISSIYIVPNSSDAGKPSSPEIIEGLQIELGSRTGYTKPIVTYPKQLHSITDSLLVPVKGSKLLALTSAGTISLSYSDGVKSYVDGQISKASNALKGSKSGEIVSMPDVSPIEHNIGVKVSGVEDLTAVTLNKCGKNVLKLDFKTTTQNNVSITKNEDGTVTVSGKPNTTNLFALSKWRYIPKGNYYFTSKPYAISTYTLQCYIQVRVDGVVQNTYQDEGNGIYVPIPNNAEIICRIVYDSNGYDGTPITLSPQLEPSPKKTSFEPYTETLYTPNADGTVDGVKSLSPTTTLLTDTAGVTIEAEYNRDINKAFAELTNALISLGGINI